MMYYNLLLITNLGTQNLVVTSRPIGGSMAGLETSVKKVCIHLCERHLAGLQIVTLGLNIDKTLDS